MSFQATPAPVTAYVGEVEQTAESTQDFSQPVAYTFKSADGAEATYTVTAADWRSIPSFYYDGDAEGRQERAFALDYHQQLNMKLYLDDPTLAQPQ